MRLSHYWRNFQSHRPGRRVTNAHRAPIVAAVLLGRDGSTTRRRWNTVSMATPHLRPSWLTFRIHRQVPAFNFQLPREGGESVDFPVERGSGPRARGVPPAV